MRVCLYIRMYVYLYACVHMCVYICICMCLGVHMCGICVNACVLMCMHVCWCAYTCVPVCLHVCVCIHMCKESAHKMHMPLCYFRWHHIAAWLLRSMKEILFIHHSPTVWSTSYLSMQESDRVLRNQILIVWCSCHLAEGRRSICFH